MNQNQKQLSYEVFFKESTERKQLPPNVNNADKILNNSGLKFPIYHG